MYTDLSSLITEVVRFTNKHQFEASFHIHTVGDLRGKNDVVPDKFWAKFERDAGIYLIFDNTKGGIHYIGMSEQDTGTRLFKWIFKDNKVNSNIDEADLVLSVVMSEQSYMAPALESYLIKKLKPKLNKRNV